MNDKVWFDGGLVDLEKAQISISAETALRGTNVFEGIRAFSNEGRLQVLALEAHLARLLRSADLLRIQHPYSMGSLRAAVSALLELAPTDEDLYLRPSICVERGLFGDEPHYKVVDYVSVSSNPRRDLFTPNSAIVSQWRKPADTTLSPLIKSGGAYLGFRLPQVEMHEAGADQVILLNERGQAAEASGAALFLVRGDRLVTPPVSDGALRSITRELVIDIAARIGVTVEERSVPHAELFEVDGVFLAGTMCELVPIASINGIGMDTADLDPYRRVSNAYDDVRRAARGATWPLDEWKI